MVLILVAAVLLLLYFAVKLLYGRFWNHKLSAKLSFEASSAFEGERTVLIEVIANRKPLPIPTMEIDFHLGKELRFTEDMNSTISDKLYRRDVFSLGMYQQITRRLELSCTKRGYYTLNSLGIMARDLFMGKKYLKKESFFGEFFVYPRKVSSSKIAVPYNKIMGEVLSRERLMPDPFEFGGIRDYMISDPMKYINWKASAKSGNLVVNLHDSSLSQKIVMVLDTYDTAAPLENELAEEGIRIAADLCGRIMASGISLSLVGNGFDLISKERLCLSRLEGLGIDQVLRTLSRLTWNGDKKIAEVIDAVELSRDSLMVLISKNLENAEYIKNRELLWICPYKNEQPKNPGGKLMFIPWKDESFVYDLGVRG